MASVPDDDLLARFGSAKHLERPVARVRPDAATDSDVDAAGKVSAAFETLEHARGHLYAFHRMSGMADLALGEAVQALRDAGHDALADEIEQVLVGRDVLPGLWTFQIIETYDEQYFEVFRAVDDKVRRVLAGDTPHVFEAEMKQREQGG